MQINKNYPCKSTNYRKGRRDSIKYIVIHYVGATGSALNNAKYYNSSNVGASAHYFVGHASENGAVYQSVAPENCAWHCGSETGKYYSECRNDSAIGIEMCCHKDSKGKWYFDDITVEKTIELVKWLMKEYGISADNVIRHYDVTHKSCPAPYVEDETKWKVFKSKLTTNTATTKELYRVAEKYENGKYVNQKGAFKSLDNAKNCCNDNVGTSVFDSNGKKVYPEEYYMVVVDTDVLRVRTGPGTNYDIATTVKRGEAFTIIEEKNGWGRLKSKVGWISLEYTKKL